MENYSQVKELYRRYLENDLSEEELDRFLNMLNNRENDFVISACLDNTWKEMYETGRPLVKEVAVKRKIHIAWYWSAASIILFMFVGGYFFFNKTNETPALVNKVNPLPATNILPGGDKAVLTLGDGTQIELDNAADGKLVDQSGIAVVNIKGQLAYHVEGQTPEVLYNTVTTPRGGQYQVVLADGSKVWLNATSSLRFPTAFTGNERNVELTGEGYFEVAPDASRQFNVKVNDINVRVIGTHFNINSYSDEPAVKTTLLEGKVLISKGSRAVNLTAGQQAIVAAGENTITVSRDFDQEGVMAWKNGYFHFEGANLQELLRQISRWYDVEVEYKGTPANRKFSGEIARTANFDEVIKVLRESGVQFILIGKKLIVAKRAQ
jgi:ferric-dicitrate binding protein FerR (iron transport regulator)